MYCINYGRTKDYQTKSEMTTFITNILDESSNVQIGLEMSGMVLHRHFVQRLSITMYTVSSDIFLVLFFFLLLNCSIFIAFGNTASMMLRTEIGALKAELEGSAWWHWIRQENLIKICSAVEGNSPRGGWGGGRGGNLSKNE